MVMDLQAGQGGANPTRRAASNNPWAAAEAQGGSSGGTKYREQQPSSVSGSDGGKSETDRLPKRGEPLPGSMAALGFTCSPKNYADGITSRVFGRSGSRCALVIPYKIRMSMWTNQRLHVIRL